eukprot:TRINITY_DN82589_c0_g1_i1.p1 TRINITY_DN82589_c0_g1~~TRINITY_DN82589_c0_g1_i1.p1  ORF type:complete len:322 (+),score=38.62 TRINITY_DN82589_c0_g1_i1:122-967(+)
MGKDDEKGRQLSGLLRGIAQTRRETEDYDGSLRHRFGVALQSRCMETIIIVLTLADLICVAMEMGIAYHWVCIGMMPLDKLGNASSHEAAGAHGPAVADAHAAAAGEEPAHHRLLRRLSEHAISSTTHMLCETEEGHTAHHLYHNLHMLSIAILSFMFVELMLKLAVHPVEFCKGIFAVVDLTIVTISLTLDIFLTTNHHLTEAVNFLIIVRFWRIARIVHGLFEEWHMEHEYTTELQEKIHELQEFAEHNNLELPEELREEPSYYSPFCEENPCAPHHDD